MINYEGAAKLSKQIIKYAIKTEQSHVQFQFPIPNSSFGYLILVITSRHPSDVFYWAGERSIPCLANHERRLSRRLSPPPHKEITALIIKVSEKLHLLQTGRYIQTCFKKLGGYNKCITRYLVVCVCCILLLLLCMYVPTVYLHCKSLIFEPAGNARANFYAH